MRANNLTPLVFSPAALVALYPCSGLRFWLVALVAGLLSTGSSWGQGQSVARVDPPPASTVTNLAQVTVTFIQPVEGVQAEDLILNGSSATNVAGSEAVFHLDSPRRVVFAEDSGWEPTCE